MILAVMDAIFDIEEKPEKIRTSTGFEPVTSQFLPLGTPLVTGEGSDSIKWMRTTCFLFLM